MLSPTLFVMFLWIHSIDIISYLEVVQGCPPCGCLQELQN